jgi:hypothetical protein
MLYRSNSLVECVFSLYHDGSASSGRPEFAKEKERGVEIALPFPAAAPNSAALYA